MTPGFPAELRRRRPSLSASGPRITFDAIRDLATHHPATATPLGIALTASSLVRRPELSRSLAGTL
jgi:hypothetical protein